MRYTTEKEQQTLEDRKQKQATAYTRKSLAFLHVLLGLVRRTATKAAVNDDGPDNPVTEAAESQDFPQVLVAKLTGVRRALAVSLKHVAGLDRVPELRVHVLLPLQPAQADAVLLVQEEVEPQNAVRRFDEGFPVDSSDKLLWDGNRLVLPLSKVVLEGEDKKILGAKVLRPHRTVLERSAVLGDVLEGFPSLLEDARAAIQ